VSRSNGSIAPEWVPTGSVTVRVPGKVNLFLGVGDLRSDGYHELTTVFHAVSLVDEVTVRNADVLSLQTVGEGAEELPADDRNLAWQAAELMAEHVGRAPDVEIIIDKSIPVAGGMAGGSADAAAVLVAMNTLWELGVPRRDLHALAAELGSDVPFALHGFTAIGSDTGTRLTTALVRGSYYWVFVLAEEGLSTPLVYREFDRLSAGRVVPEPVVPDALMTALRAGDAVALGKALCNDLQQAAVHLRPHLAQVLSIGHEYGALGGVVSGSGPTCAFLARDDAHAVDLAVAFSASGVCRTVKRAIGPVPGARVVDHRSET